MKKTFQKTLLAAAAGMALVSGVAQADDNLLFPYISSVSGGYTFISITTDANAAVAGGSHYYYMTKLAGATGNCEHFDGLGTNTQNDLFQFEMSKQSDLITATGDTTSTPLTMASTGKEGYLVVTANTPDVASRYTGEATLVSVGSGLMYTYNGITAPSAAGNPDFGNAATGLQQTNRIFQWYADPAVSTAFYIAPVGTLTNMKGGALTVSVKSVSNKGVNGDEGAFDNNEKLWSGAVSKTITCFGSVKPSDLLGSDTYAKVKNGGYMEVGTGAFPGNTTGWAVSKVQKIVGSNITSVNRPVSAALTTAAPAATDNSRPNL